jgi:hypothetical protein
VMTACENRADLRIDHLLAAQREQLVPRAGRSPEHARSGCFRDDVREGDSVESRPPSISVLPRISVRRLLNACANVAGETACGPRASAPDSCAAPLQPRALGDVRSRGRARTADAPGSDTTTLRYNQRRLACRP